MLKAMQEDSNISRDLKPSQELLETLARARKSNISTVDLVKEAYNLAIRDGFKPREARDFLMAELPFLSESTIRKALPQEAKDLSKIREKTEKFAIRHESQNDEPKESNYVNITTKATMQDADLVKKDSPPQMIKKNQRNWN